MESIEVEISLCINWAFVAKGLDRSDILKSNPEAFAEIQEFEKLIQVRKKNPQGNKMGTSKGFLLTLITLLTEITFCATDIKCFFCLAFLTLEPLRPGFRVFFSIKYLQIFSAVKIVSVTFEMVGYRKRMQSRHYIEPNPFSKLGPN